MSALVISSKGILFATFTHQVVQTFRSIDGSIIITPIRVERKIWKTRVVVAHASSTLFHKENFTVSVQILTICWKDAKRSKYRIHIETTRMHYSSNHRWFMGGKDFSNDVKRIRLYTNQDSWEQQTDRHRQVREADWDASGCDWKKCKYFRGIKTIPVVNYFYVRLYGTAFKNNRRLQSTSLSWKLLTSVKAVRRHTMWELKRGFETRKADQMLARYVTEPGMSD